MLNRAIAVVLAFGLLTAAPLAQFQIQRGYGPTIPAGSSGTVAGLGGVLTVSTTEAQTTAVTTEETLWTYSLPANTLSANNYGLRITTFGAYAANGNTKTVKVYLGATVIASGSSTDNNVQWRYNGEIFRTGASAQLVNMVRLVASTTVQSGVVSAAIDTTAAITIKVTGQNGTASAGDIVFRGAVVEFLRAGS